MLTLLLACTGTAPPESAPPPVIVATSFPAWYLGSRLHDGEVRCILPPGEDPQEWQPDGALIAELAGADLIISSGAGFEAWMQTAALPERRVLDLSAGVDLITLDAPTHSHGIGGEHSHAGIDPHAWADPTIYAQQAEAVSGTLGPLVSDAGGLEQRRAALAGELAALDQELAAVLESGRLPPLKANHPAYHYLARRYGLTIPSLDLDPEVAPAAPVAVEPGTVLLWESPPSPAVRSAVEAHHVVIDPLEQPRAGQAYDYITQSRSNAALFAEILAEVPDGDDSPQ